jgi:hypothetical protein
MKLPDKIKATKQKPMGSPKSASLSCSEHIDELPSHLQCFHPEDHIFSKCIHGIDIAESTCCDRYPLLTFEHLPVWLRDNPHIERGYRVNIGWKRSCESVCHLHNETVNVW